MQSRADSAQGIELPIEIALPAPGGAFDSVSAIGAAVALISRMNLAPVVVACSLVLFSSSAFAKECSDEEKDELRREILEPATDDTQVHVKCDVTLSPTDVVSKRLLFKGPESSGVTLDCKGATLTGKKGDVIEIRSTRIAPGEDTDGDPKTKPLATFKPVSNVTVRSCHIIGSVRVWGMGKNGEAEDVRDSSRQAGHPGRVRLAAPWYITLEDLLIEGTGRIPLYLGPGVSYATLRKSEIAGGSSSVGIYLDTESFGNTIRDNYIHVDTGELEFDREQLAIDGSMANRIINNRFSHLNRGGITMYRNCGEGGTVRHTGPTLNEIINNVFYYTTKFSGKVPAISVGTRNGSGIDSDNIFRNYCGDDAGFPWGSSVDDRDFAQHNVIMQNQIYVRPVNEAIVVPWPDPNSPNAIAHNTSVTTPVERRAGCYLKYGYPSFLEHGRSTNIMQDSAGGARCSTHRYTCNDGVITWTEDFECTLSVRTFGCDVTNDNGGCAREVDCGPGKVLVGVRAACNLEWGDVTAADIDATAGDSLRVTVPSSHPSQSSCWFGDTAVQTGEATAYTTRTSGPVSYGCYEHEASGGDCEIRGVAYCAAE